MIVLLGDFNAKLGRDIFKPTIGNERLCQDSKNNGVRILNFATSKNLVFKSRIFSTDIFVSTARPRLIGRPTTRLITY